jgi:hypothetical protein
MHEPLPPLRVAVQRLEESMLKVTVPVGVPGPAVGATDVEKETGEPEIVFAGLTEAVVDVGARSNALPVPMIIPPPTATQSVDEAHETPAKPATPGVFSIVQIDPPLVVAIATPEIELVLPTATQSADEGHEMPARVLTALGTF